MVKESKRCWPNEKDEKNKNDKKQRYFIVNNI
jgi:hypothetical protein